LKRAILVLVLLRFEGKGKERGKRKEEEVKNEKKSEVPEIISFPSFGAQLLFLFIATATTSPLRLRFFVLQEASSHGVAQDARGRPVPR
jgi:hypothetical protein